MAPLAAPQDFIREIVAADVAAGKQRRTRRHALSARAERLPAHRPRQGDLPRLRRSPASSAATATCASTTPTRSRKTSSTSIRSRTTCAGSGSTGTIASTTRRTTTSSCTSSPSSLIREGRRLRRLAVGRRDPRASRHADRAGQGLAVPRPRSVDENLDLFRRMRAGEFPDGAHVLRAKIDMASPNINMRDPVLYRIRHAEHHRTGNAWCIYPMYDFAHPLSDAIEGVTHSLCTLEYEDHRPLYDWVDRARRHRASSAAVRVRAAQPELHGDEQAQAAAAGRAEARHRLGRSADADDLRPAPPRLHAGIDPRLLRARSAWPRRKTSSTSACSSTACARISTAARRARWRCCGR